jgi:RNA polymerase sigma-70 factor (ECF subfamily)
MTLREELNLAELAKKGDKPAVGALWDAITPKLFGYLVNTLRDRALAEDVLQETWLKAITAMDKFENRQVRFSAWLFAIARNVCREHWRTQNRTVAVTDEELETTAGSADHVSRLNNEMDLDRVLENLSDDDKEILRLRYIAGLAFSEIGKILKTSSIAARVRVHRAIGRARAVTQTKK